MAKAIPIRWSHAVSIETPPLSTFIAHARVTASGLDSAFMAGNPTSMVQYGHFLVGSHRHSGSIWQTPRQ